MPLCDSITIQLADISIIMEILIEKKYDGNIVKIIDTPRRIILRDQNDFHIDSFPKANSNEKTETSFLG